LHAYKYSLFYEKQQRNSPRSKDGSTVRAIHPRLQGRGLAPNPDKRKLTALPAEWAAIVQRMPKAEDYEEISGDVPR